ncbi:MAG TPA: hypothetical protein VIY72_08435 [Acidimicrobiales bacterium]
MIKRITFGVPVVSPTPPVRVVRCVALPDLTPDPFAEVVTVEWFETPLGAGSLAGDEGDLGDVVIEEHVVRGLEWLDARWRDDGDRFKHMAFARRAPSLTVAEFASRWRSHAGTLGGASIPEEIKGRAYAQNLPVPRAAGEWPFDAVNEVWFDDLDGLRRRVEWFQQYHEPTGDDLFGPSVFLAVRETVVR